MTRRNDQNRDQLRRRILARQLATEQLTLVSGAGGNASSCGETGSAHDHDIDCL